MSGVNQITIVGRVGAAPELAYGRNNTPYCRFSVAVNEQFRSGGERRESVTWFRCVAFNGLGESCANFAERGRLLAVQGRVETREYEDRRGTKHQVMQVVAQRVTFLGAAKREEQGGPSPVPPREPEVADEDVPF